MKWTLILSNADAGEPQATEAEFTRLVGLIDQTELVGLSLRIIAALGNDRSARFRTVGGWLESFADEFTVSVLERLRSMQGNDAAVEITEVWRQWLIVRHALQHAPETGGLTLESLEGRATFFKICRSAGSLASPPTPDTTGDMESDVLKAAAAVIPSMWLHNPPNLSNAVGRMIFFLKRLPDLVSATRPHAESLLSRFESELGGPFDDVRDIIAFLGYASMAVKSSDVIQDGHAALFDPSTWLSKTNVDPNVWNNVRRRITLPISDLIASTPGEGSRWFDPLSLRNRPLVEMPNGMLMVSLPMLLAEKANFEMFWWLTEGPGGALQRDAWQAAFGKLCEHYVLWMLQRSAADGRGMFVPNVAWNHGRDQGEIDALFFANGRLIVVEISGSFVGNAAKMGGDWERLGRGLDTAFVERSGNPPYREAVAQLDRDLSWLAERRAAGQDVAGIPLRSIETIHPIVIAADRVVRTQGVWRLLDKRLHERRRDDVPWQVAPLAVLGLEDVENIHELIVRHDDRLEGTLPPLLHILRRWQFDSDRNHAFWQFLNDGFENDYAVSHLKELADEWFEGVKERFDAGA